MRKETERERGHIDEEEIDNISQKSKESQAFKLFSEGKNTVEVVIAVDLPADEVGAIYRIYWQLERII